MANDIYALMQHCEFGKAAMVGHDRGARVATRLAKDHPQAVERLVVMDNIPTRIIFHRMNAEIAVYVKAYSQPGALRGAFSDYRAGKEDVVQDDADADSLIQCPTLALWGEDFELGGKMWDFREIWNKMASQMSFVSIPKCGHLPHEEKPDIVNRELLRFLEPWSG